MPTATLALLPVVNNYVAAVVQNGQLLYNGVVRHIDPRRCPVAADGLYQLWRFTFENQEFPDFNGDPELW